jgi:CubicO group peptidase (beta-lactamase class C family)
MHIARNFLAALSLVVGLVGCSSVPTLPTTANASERGIFLDEWVDRTLARQQRADAPGVAMLIVKDGKVLATRSKGMADATHAIDEDTVFDLASVSKPITAIAVVQLSERKLLALDDSILKWLPELPPEWKDVTIHHLLSQQSGVPDPIQVAYTQFRGLNGVSNKELIQRWHDAPLKFEPGSKAEYSNGNYVLLAEIISRVSRQSYSAYLKQHIFEPAGMRETFVTGDKIDTSPHLALAYARTTKIYGIDLALQGPTGICSSVSDVRRLIDSLLAGRLVSHDSLLAMTRPEANYPLWGDNADDQESYGYGFFVRPNGAPLTRFSHTGDMDGYRAYLRVNVSKGVYYIILGNAGKQGWPVMKNLAAVVQMAYERD